MNDFCVFVGFNKNYLDSFHLFLNSYIRNSGLTDIDFYIFSSGITKEDIKIKFDFTLINIDDEKYSEKCISTNNMRTKEFGLGAPLRLDGFDYLKSKYKYGMYFDSDMIINDALAELVQVFDEDLLAVRDDGSDFSEQYFNSGFMVINFATIGDFNFAESYRNSTEVYPYYDQDFLNNHYKEKNVKLLPAIYNAAPSKCINTKVLFENRDIIKESKIVHFTGNKPWVNPVLTCILSQSLQWPLDIFYREYRLVEHLLSENCKQNVLNMENTLLIEIKNYEERFATYQAKRKTNLL